MTKAERVSGHRSGTLPTASAFEFGVETRVQCLESGRISYKQDAPTNILSINIPVEAADNQEEVDLYKVIHVHHVLISSLYPQSSADWQA